MKTHSDIAKNDVTLIIPTYNRPKLLSRLLNYYAAKKSNLSFIILDSSNQELRESNSQACSVLGNQAQYITFPSTMPVAAKLLEGLNITKTRFCAFCADDDLVFLEGLKAATSFLKNNDDYVCADGIYLNFGEVGHDIQLHVEYASHGITANDPGARVFNLYQKYESLFYGVYRIEHALAIFNSVSKNASLHYQELFQATSALLLGKSHRLVEFYAARQSCAPADTTRDKWQTYYWFADNTKEFIEHYLIYRNELWEFYQKHCSITSHSQTSFFHIMDLAHAMYFGLGCPPEYFHTMLQSKWPADLFKKPNIHRDNIYNQLKSPRQLAFENRIEKWITWLHNKKSALYSNRYIKSLNSEIKKTTNISWNCVLNPELRWLAKVDIFRKSYHELCQYISLSS